ncbi:acyltransferase [Demequina sp. NBRC 110057]|uniref:acyltransferase n=1 Tax=Demequina sp. NBRC 110057 TaxID=1570346 RepID=UPI000A04B28B|nr:acyltransferase [Demequina sp. NBRC 110057]
MVDESRSSRDIIDGVFEDFDGQRFLFDASSLPSATYVKQPLDAFAVSNPEHHDVGDSFVWMPKRNAAKIASMLSFEVMGASPHARILIMRTPQAGQQEICLKGPHARLLSLSASRMKYRALLSGTSSLIIGSRTFIGGARILLRDTDMSIGAGGLWSDEVVVQGTDQHGIISLETGLPLNAGRKTVDIGRRVWVGRRAMVMKDISIGDGSIIGAGAVVAKSVPAASVAGGNPAKVIKSGVTWTHSPDGPLDFELPDLERLRGAELPSPLDAPPT